MFSSMSPRKSSIESKAGGWVWSLEKGEEGLEWSLRGWDSSQQERNERLACYTATVVWLGLERRICSEISSRFNNFLSSQSLEVGVKEMGSELPKAEGFRLCLFSCDSRQRSILY